MATPNVGILTNAGKNLIDRVNAGQTKITFTKIVFSSMDNSQLTDDKIRALTTVAPQEVVVNNPEVTLDNSTGETRIRATGTNEKLDDGVYVKTYGVFARDDTGNEILYGLTVSPNPNYFPAYDGLTPQVVTYSYKVIISNTSNITFTNSNDIYLSENDLSESLKPYAKIVYVNQQLDNKVTDNKDGTEQLNGVRVQPYNKLSDTIGGRNLVKDSEQEFTGKAYDFHYYNLVSITKLTPGKTYTMSFIAKVDDKAVKCNQHLFVDIYNPSWKYNAEASIPISTDYQRSITTFTVSEGQTDVAIIATCLSHPVINGKSDSSADKNDVAGTGYIKEFKLEQGSIATDWTPAPEDKVNVSDMRKPANDVAGIEEVNAKQDKIGYTPADDSKVVHNSGTEEIADQKTFDIAPIDKTTGNPYITKDGVPNLPPDIARTGKSQTFTAAQTFSIAPTITDASRDKEDNQAAVMADLKSVEKAAWHQLDVNISENNYTCTGLILYREINSSTLEITGNVLPSSSSAATGNSPHLFPIFQLSEYSELSSTSLMLYFTGSEEGGALINVSFQGNTAYIDNGGQDIYNSTISGNLNFIVTRSMMMGAPTVSFTK